MADFTHAVRSNRLVAAKAAVIAADRYLAQNPAATAAPLVRTLRDTVSDLISEVRLLAATGGQQALTKINSPKAERKQTDVHEQRRHGEPEQVDIRPKTQA